MHNSSKSNANRSIKNLFETRIVNSKKVLTSFLFPLVHSTKWSFDAKLSMCNNIICILFRWITPVSLFLYFFSDFYLGVFPLLDTPNIPYDVLIDEGDLNLGALYSVRDRSGDINDPCGGPIQNARLQQNIEAIVYTINKVNADDPIHRYVHVIICNVHVL